MLLVQCLLLEDERGIGGEREKRETEGEKERDKKVKSRKERRKKADYGNKLH